MASLIEPDVRVLVNLGYGSPHQGWSTGPPNVPPFGRLPPLAPGEVTGALVGGAQQGVGDFAREVQAVVSNASLSSLLDSLPQPSLGVIERILASPTGAVNTVASAVAGGYSVVLPTADFATTALLSLPAYDVSLFADGLGQALAGDPVGLINAIGNPIAADVGLFSIAAGFETLVLVSAAQSILSDLSSL